MLINWNETVFVCQNELIEIDLFCHFTECKQKSILILNIIVKNITILSIKTDLSSNHL